MISRIERVALDDRIVGVRRWGAAPPQVVLLHGAGGNRDSLAPLGDALADAGVDVAALSLPGRGGSDGDGVDSIVTAAAWVTAALDVLAPDGTVLLGHSMGGAVALEVALTAPATARGLVLAATGARLRVHPDTLSTAAELADSGQSLVTVGMASLRPDGPATARSHVATADAATPGLAALADWQAVDAFDRMGHLDRITAPTLVIAGEVDRLTPPKYAEYLADHIRSAELTILPGAGHWLPVEEAPQVAAAVAAFLLRLPDPGE